MEKNKQFLTETDLNIIMVGLHSYNREIDNYVKKIDIEIAKEETSTMILPEKQKELYLDQKKEIDTAMIKINVIITKMKNFELFDLDNDETLKLLGLEGQYDKKNGTK